MKRLFLGGLACLAMGSVALGRTDALFSNTTPSVWPPGSPPVIDATNFFNNSGFIDNTFNSAFVQPYGMTHTVNYTNRGVMGALEGFRFDTWLPEVPPAGIYTSAGTLFNAAGAVINCGGTNNGTYFSTNFGYYFIAFGAAECDAWATNIINRGTIEMGQDTLLSLRGQNVFLSGGLLNMEGFETGNFFGDTGVFPGYWGLGETPNYNPTFYFSSFPASPTHWVTNRYYSAMQTAVSVPLGNAYLNPGYALGPSNYWWQVVFLRNWDRSVSNNVYFPYDSVVEWLWLSTNIVTGVIQTNSMYLDDRMIQYTNLSLVTNGIAPASTGYGRTFIPTNYWGSFLVGQQPFFLGTPANPTVVSGIFGPSKNIQSEYTAYEAAFLPTSEIVSEVANRSYSKMDGRIEITADKHLELNSSRIAGLNYLQITATNNFSQDANTRILTAIADYNLGVTNATLTVSNLLAPTCPRPSGYIQVFSTRWTNIDNSANAFFPGTNTYFVTMVDSYLTNASPSAVQNLTLHATNVVISDVLNVLSNITIDAYNVTITTNGPGAQTPIGQLIFPPGRPLGASQLPRLRNLTNNGLISIQNSAVFGAAGQPLWNFVNHGTIQTMGCSIATTNCENTGLIDAGPGPLTLTANTATLSNGVFNAALNDLILSGSRLFISNHVLTAGLQLQIEFTDSLGDGGPASGNVWRAGVSGVSLPIAPPEANLLGTTITDTAPGYTYNVPIQWAGQDRGPVVAGFSNNAALGRLILDGGTPSSFEIFGAGATNALYVDYLEFRNCLTNFDGSGNLANLYFGPDMKIYYAQLIINGVSWAEKLNHKNNGALNWVSSYAGAFSGTNIVYRDGTTNRLNQALVQSCDLDSNFNGIANCQDSEPVFVPSQVGLAAKLAPSPQHAVILSWNSIPYSTNTVFYRPSVTPANWQVLTNFVLGPVGGRQQVTNVLAVSSRFYRVQVDALAP